MNTAALFLPLTISPLLLLSCAHHQGIGDPTEDNLLPIHDQQCRRHRCGLVARW